MIGRIETLLNHNGRVYKFAVDSIERDGYGCLPHTKITGFIYGDVDTNQWGASIKNVIFNDPATIVFWSDGTKTVVKCQKGDTYSKELGLAMCIAKKHFGNKGNFNKVFKRWL